MLINPTEIERNVTTRDGAPLILFAYMSQQARPYMGIYHNMEEWLPCSWNKDGTYINRAHTTGLDLLIVSPVEKEVA